MGQLSALAHGAVPSTQRDPDPSTSRFQIGASALIRSIASRAAGKGLLAMGGGGGDDHAGLPERHRAGAVLGGGRLEPVPLDAARQDRRDPLLGHLTIGLVFEPVDVTGGALKADDRARARPPDHPRDVANRERLLGDTGVDVAPATDRGDQRELIARASTVAGSA